MKVGPVCHKLSPVDREESPNKRKAATSEPGEFPSKFPSGVDRETENPAASTADDKAASYATLFTSQMSHRRAKLPRKSPQAERPRSTG